MVDFQARFVGDRLQTYDDTRIISYVFGKLPCPRSVALFRTIAVLVEVDVEHLRYPTECGHYAYMLLLSVVVVGTHRYTVSNSVQE